MSVLESVDSPRDLAPLTPAQLVALASEIRDFLVEKVAKNGGHLGPNLGVVELTIALHRVFSSPTDVILWDTGHQAYVHKILTGRRGDFGDLRKRDGLSGYPSRAESEHDVIENSHASTALAYADGIAKGWQREGVLAGHDGPGRHVVAVVGDGALTGGMAWEAINNIAAAKDRQVVIVVNDNARSYAPTIGGMADHLATLRATGGYERFLDWGRRVLHRTPVVGHATYETLHGLKKGVKDIVAPQGMFEDLGLKYIGPVDGHDIAALEHALRLARDFPGPVIVHTITRKGCGYPPAEQDEADRFHGVGVIDPDTGRALGGGGLTWTEVFSSELAAIGRERDDIVAITAAMLAPTGLTEFAEQFPERTFDVGIAEQHAIASAAGLAYAGMHPVVALYATFLNRAFDQLLLDCAMHRAGVTVALDRAGVTGDDGASHNGVWDLSMLRTIPGVRVAAPRDGTRLRELLREAVAVDDAPTVVRYPKGRVPRDCPAIESAGGVDVLDRRGDPDVLIVSVGAMAGLCLDVAGDLTAQAIGVTVVDPGWVQPLPPRLTELAAAHRLVVTVEDGVRTGGVGSAVSQQLRDAGIDVPARDIGLPPGFLSHGTRTQVLTDAGLSAPEIARRIAEIAGTLARDEVAGPAVTRAS